MNWEKVLGIEHCQHEGQMLKIEFRFVPFDGSPSSDCFAQLLLLTPTGWTKLKEVLFNECTNGTWIPNMEHAVLSLKAYAALLFAPEEYAAAYQAFKSKFKRGGHIHANYQNQPLPDPESSRFFNQCVVAAVKADSFEVLQPPCTGTVGEATLRVWKKARSSYLAVLLGLPPETPSDQVWKVFREARAKALGIALDTSEEDLMRAELLNPDKSLTIRKLRDHRQDLLRLQPE